MDFEIWSVSRYEHYITIPTTTGFDLWEKGVAKALGISHIRYVRLLKKYGAKVMLCGEFAFSNREDAQALLDFLTPNIILAKLKGDDLMLFLSRITDLKPFLSPRICAKMIWVLTLKVVDNFSRDIGRLATMAAEDSVIQKYLDYHRNKTPKMLERVAGIGLNPQTCRMLVTHTLEHCDYYLDELPLKDRKVLILFSRKEISFSLEVEQSCTMLVHIMSE